MKTKLLKNANHVKDFEFASLFGKLKYEENLIDSIYDTENKSSLSTATPLSTAFFSNSVVQDFQDSLDDDEDTRCSQEFSGAKATDQTECFKCGRTGHFAKDYEEEVSSNDNEMVEVKVLMALADDESGVIRKESAKNGKWVKISSKKCINEQIPNQKRKILGADQLTNDSSISRQTDLVFVKSSSKDSNVSKLNVKRPWLSEAEGFNLPNHDTGRILSIESHMNGTDCSVTVNVTDSSVTDYDSSEESTSTIKSILKSCSTRKAETSKGVIIYERNNSSTPAKGNKTVSAPKRNSATAGKLKNVKTKDRIPMSVVMKELNDL
ncbi:retrovirus-related pol polyprotein from transposon TNT 1-94 [Tanacetum coccineum]